MADTKKATTVAGYLRGLPAERRRALEAVRAVVLENLGEGYEEGMQYGMIGYYVPHSVYAAGYHCDPKQPLPFLGLGNQKNHMAAYMFCLYCDPKVLASFEKTWKASGKKLDMGKACVRFKDADGVCLEAIGAAVRAMPVERFVKAYEGGLKKPAAKKVSKKASKKAAAKKVGKKKVVKKK